MLKLLIATTNAAKAARLAELCAIPGIDLEHASSADAGPVVQETATSHLGDATLKAVEWSRMERGAAIASDGGLAIPALGDHWESLVTRRSTGGDVSDEEHATRLLRRMRNLEGVERSAYWIEAIAVANEGKLVGAWEAKGLDGFIAEAYTGQPNGPAGFWIEGLWHARGSGQLLRLFSPADRIAAGDPWAKLAAPVRDLLTRMAG